MKPIIILANLQGLDRWWRCPGDRAVYTADGVCQHTVRHGAVLFPRVCRGTRGDSVHPRGERWA